MLSLLYNQVGNRERPERRDDDHSGPIRFLRYRFLRRQSKNFFSLRHSSRGLPLKGRTDLYKLLLFKTHAGPSLRLATHPGPLPTLTRPHPLPDPPHLRDLEQARLWGRTIRVRQHADEGQGTVWVGQGTCRAGEREYEYERRCRREEERERRVGRGGCERDEGGGASSDLGGDRAGLGTGKGRGGEVVG